MTERRLHDLWDQLRGKKPHMPHFLAEIRLDGIRGMRDVRVSFDYPVSVIAGENASGKSTVLFAAACAYKVPGAGYKDYVPSTLFPDYRPKLHGREDEKPQIKIEFEYDTNEGRRYMLWRRSKGWNRSFGGRKHASQPERNLYLRTLSNLRNPSEVRGVLSMSRLASAPEESHLTASQIAFAQQMLPFRYTEVVDLSSGNKTLLFATQQDGAAYSELHMAAGERAILRLSQEIAQLSGALVLIDEIEAGLHPRVQELLMLQLQQLALRNNLQVIITTHSPIILNSVPLQARIFLARDEAGDVIVAPPYRDIIQDALYGRSASTLYVLCEDKAAEAILNGIFDALRPKLHMPTGSVTIAHDTGADEFPAHAAAFKRFDQIHQIIFVLDGDRRDTNVQERIIKRADDTVPVLFLPGNDAPEIWVWDRLRELPASELPEIGVSSHDLVVRMTRCDSIYDSASDSPSQIAKSKLDELASGLDRTAPELCRIIARLEANRQTSGIQPLVEELELAFSRWRSE